MAKNFDLEAIDRDYLFHPITNLKNHFSDDVLILDRGEGIYIFDKQGKKYIDGLAGLWCTSLGHGVTELAEAAKEQMSKLGYSTLFASKSHEPAILLAEKLIEMSPFSSGKVFFGLSGSDANDTQYKLFTYANNKLGKTSKKKILARQKGYHGVTVASASMTGLANQHKLFDLPQENFIHTETPHYFKEGKDGESEEEYLARLIEALEKLIIEERPDSIAAMIAEPLMGAGGVILPPKGYFPAIQAILKKYDIPLIADEVVTAFGRTGNPFGTETYDIQPTSMTIAKALSSGYIPISAVIVNDELFEPIKEASGDIGVFGHGYTYSGHPVSCAVALKTLEIYEKEKTFQHAQRVGEYFQKSIKKLLDEDFVGEVRGIGLIAGVELYKDPSNKVAFEEAGKAGKILSDICQKNGLIVRPILDTIALCPPLIISEKEVDELADKLKKSLQEAKDEIMKVH
jgi:4-aminobutyrate--pyruvate transaminase